MLVNQQLYILDIVLQVLLILLNNYHKQHHQLKDYFEHNIHNFIDLYIENGINIEEMCTQIKNGINQHVIFCYSDYLCDFGKWCVQLISESLGKRKDFGITPINAIGTIDQHSMLQLFLGGPKDKMYSIVTQNIQPKTVALLNGNMAGYNIGDLMLAHQKSTIDILRKNAYTQVFAYDQFNEYNMGHLMMVFVLQTIEIAKHFNINPFDQPAVEASKSAILQNLCLLHK